MRAQEITDGLVDFLIQIVHKIDVRAEKKVEEEYVNKFKRVANKEEFFIGLLKQRSNIPKKVNEVVFPVAAKNCCEK